MPLTKLNGININYKVEGQGEPLVMGFTANRSGWIPRFFSTLVDTHICDTHNILMGYRKGKDSSTEPVIGNTKGALTLGLVFIIIGIAGAVLKLSVAGALFFILAGIGVILLSIGDEIILWTALSLFGIALISLGIALCPLLS